jgi:hypothetical protein
LVQGVVHPSSLLADCVAGGQAFQQMNQHKAVFNMTPRTLPLVQLEVQQT